MKDYKEIRQTRSIIDQMEELHAQLEDMQMHEQVIERLQNNEPLGDLLPWAFPIVGTEEGDLEDVYAVCAYFYHPTLGKEYFERVKEFLISRRKLQDDPFTQEEHEHISASVSTFYMVDQHEVLRDYLAYSLDREPDKKTIQALEPQINDYLRKSVCSRYEIPERPMFDGGGVEAERMGRTDVLDIWMWLYQRGYSPVTMGKRYLVSHTDIYASWRRSGLLTRFFELTLKLIECFLEDSDDDKEFFNLYVTILNPEEDEDWDWIHYAMFFEEALRLCNEKIPDSFPMRGYNFYNFLLRESMYDWELKLRRKGLIKELSK